MNGLVHLPRYADGMPASQSPSYYRVGALGRMGATGLAWSVTTVTSGSAPMRKGIPQKLVPGFTYSTDRPSRYTPMACSRKRDATLHRSLGTASCPWCVCPLSVRSAPSRASPGHRAGLCASTMENASAGTLAMVRATSGATGYDVHVTSVGAPLATPLIANQLAGTSSSYVGIPAGEYLTARLEMDREPAPGAPADTSAAAFRARYGATLQALDKASDRVTMWKIGTSDEGRDMVSVAIADETTIRGIDKYKQITARLTDPRKLPEAEAWVKEALS